MIIPSPPFGTKYVDCAWTTIEEHIMMCEGCSNWNKDPIPYETSKRAFA
jgi:hypothetical protein